MYTILDFLRYLNYIMKLHFDAAALSMWLEEAQWADISYHRTRRELLERLQKLSRRADDALFPMQSNQYTSLVTVLSVRNDGLNDNSRLAFITLLLELNSQVEEFLAQQADHDDQPAP